MENYKYTAFGLVIESQIEIPEFIPSEGVPDLTIEIGDTPLHLEQPITSGVRFEANDQEFLLRMDNIGNYYASHGKHITISPKSDALEQEVRLFLLGSVMGAILHQKSLLPLHASSLDIDGKAIVLCGISGSGKSTLAASFIKQGGKILSDDISVVRFQNSKPYIIPGYPHMKLWADTVSYLGKNPEKYQRIRPHIEKHSITYAENFSTSPLPLMHIFILSLKNSEGLEIKPITGMDKFVTLKTNTYRFIFTEGSKHRENHLSQTGKLANMVNITKIMRPRKGFHTTEIIDSINHILGK